LAGNYIDAGRGNAEVIGDGQAYRPVGAPVYGRLFDGNDEFLIA